MAIENFEILFESEIKGYFTSKSFLKTVLIFYFSPSKLLLNFEPNFSPYLP